MPIQIRELVVTATIQEQPEQGNPTHDATNPNSKAFREQLVQECVDQVMKAMKQQIRR